MALPRKAEFDVNVLSSDTRIAGAGVWAYGDVNQTFPAPHWVGWNTYVAPGGNPGEVISQEYYYDPTHVFYGLYDYTGDAQWLTIARKALAFYLNYAEVNDPVRFAEVPPRQGLNAINNFPHGVYLDATRNPDATAAARARQVLFSLAMDDSFGTAESAWASLVDLFSAREVAYNITAKYYAIDAGYANVYGANPWGLDDATLIGKAFAFVDQAISLLGGDNSVLGTDGNPIDVNHRYVRPFMMANLAEALIHHYEHTADSRVIPKLTTLFNALWTACYLPNGVTLNNTLPLDGNNDSGGTQVGPGAGGPAPGNNIQYGFNSLIYTNILPPPGVDTGSNGWGIDRFRPTDWVWRYWDAIPSWDVPKSSGTWPTPELNGLILPIYFWLYQHTADATQLARADALFDGMVRVSNMNSRYGTDKGLAYDNYGKAFNQMYSRIWPYVTASVAASSIEPIAPTLPTPVNTTVSASKRTINIATTAQLVAYVNRTGDTLGPGGTNSGGPTYGDDVVCAVTTFTGAGVGTSYTLPPPVGTQTGNDYVTFRSANLALLPPAGTRVSAADAVNMPTFLVDGINLGGRLSNGFFIVADNVDHYRFVGLHVTTSGAEAGGFLFLQSPGSATSTTNHPHHMLVERCLIHPDPAWGGVNGFQAAGAHIAIVDSRVYDIYRPEGGGEQHGILFAGGAGPYLIRNCEVTSESICIFIGDNELMTPPTVPSDITVQNNWIHKPAKWNTWSNLYSTGTATISANGLQVTLSGAVASAGWADGATYFAITDASGNNPTASRLITGVNVQTSVLTLATASPGAGTTGQHFRITLWGGLVKGSLQSKNLHEHKHAKRVLIENNVFDTCPVGNQPTGFQIISIRASGGKISDFTIRKNYFSQFSNAIGITIRPQVSFNGANKAITNVSNSNGICKVTIPGHQCLSGETAEIANIQGTPEVNGTWTITVLDANNFTVPALFVTGHVYTALTGTCLISKSGEPTNKVAITHNIFEDMGSRQMCPVASPRILIMNSCPNLGDGPATSTTGRWSFDNFLFEHNTIVSPTTAQDILTCSLVVNLAGSVGSVYALSDWLGANWAFRNNIWKLASAASSSAAALWFNQDGANLINGLTDVFNKISDPATRTMAKNVCFRAAPGFTAFEQSRIKSPDSSVVVPDETNLGFASYVAGNLSGYALTPLWSGTCTVSAANPAVLTAPSVPFPSTIVAGTPFKVNSNGSFVLVASATASQITLAGSYPTTGSGLTSTLGFQGWATDGGDPGADMTVLASAVANSVSGTSGGGGGIVGSATGIVGAVGLTGYSNLLGLALRPQTP